ncbi:MAG: tetratricopeptide repeat protein [Anaerolineae bacterium]|nr:tetratricopeptide repeat protein [Anaerolineae bacterium]
MATKVIIVLKKIIARLIAFLAVLMSKTSDGGRQAQRSYRMGNNQSMLQLANHYHELTQNLIKNKNISSSEKVLDSLITRDRIAHLWRTAGPADLITAGLIAQGDQQLKAMAQSISHMKELKAWRESFNPSTEAWWWPAPSAEKPPGFLERFDWLWTAVALTFLTIAIGLVTDIAPRFLSGGPDTWGALVVVIQSVLALLTTSSILTKTGQDAAKRILNSLKFPRRLWEEAGLIVALLVLIALIIFRLLLPRIAVSYNNSGIENHCNGRLSTAQLDYTRALKLNPDYSEAHFNLGLLFEELQDTKQAQSHYQNVVQQGELVIGYNNLAHLYILEKNYAAAIPLLSTSLQKLEKGEIKEGLVRCQPTSDITNQNVEQAPAELLRYEILKNLGWARLGQERYYEAEPYLEKAINLIPDKAPAYCLRAQVREGQGDADNALKDWETCLQFASSYNADEDVWIGLARQKFQ